LPIILESFAQENKLIAIEQPELHLHPALQAELGDVFIESALGENKNTFLLETHSEHLILRILRRIRETTRNKLREGAIPVRSDDIAVLYVEPGEDGSVVRELRVNNQGRFIDDWPNGFFEERFSEEF
jgi:predicted ATPase